ncbi:UNVERIFIED_CONTAM: hypothetical protein FKN15_078130 [Acipenser sinensis]
MVYKVWYVTSWGRIYHSLSMFFTFLFRQEDDEELSELVSFSGLSKLASVPAGGAIAAAVTTGGAPASASGAAPAAEEKKEEKKEESEESDEDMGFGLFD